MLWKAVSILADENTNHGNGIKYKNIMDGSEQNQLGSMLWRAIEILSADTI
ncbi:MAG: hypothetical protein ACI9L9_001037 [Marivirga sp.]|jgi:hypothetical protein